MNFRAALTEGPKQSGIFEEIRASGEADRRCGRILGLNRRGLFEKPAEFTVHGQIFKKKRDPAAGSEIVYAQLAMAASDISEPRKRVRVPVENTTRDNIADFLGRLRRWLAVANGP
jgi:hypothetical protein